MESHNSLDDVLKSLSSKLNPRQELSSGGENLEEQDSDDVFGSFMEDEEDEDAYDRQVFDMKKKNGNPKSQASVLGRKRKYGGNSSPLETVKKKAEKQYKKTKKPPTKKQKKKNVPVRRWADSDAEEAQEDTEDIDLDELIQEEAEEPRQLTVKPINILPQEEARLSRIQTLRSQPFAKTESKCKFCSFGDGRVNGLSSKNMNSIYEMERLNKEKMMRHQFIRMIVDQYNKLVYNENMMKNPELQIPKLHYDEYEYHMIECIEKYDVKSHIWERILILREESDTMRRRCAKFLREDGAYLIDHKIYSTIAQIETRIEKYLAQLVNIGKLDQAAVADSVKQKSGKDKKVYG